MGLFGRHSAWSLLFHRSKWVPRGDYIASNTDECTATLMYAVNLKQSGTVNFEYYYPDSSIIFEFFVSSWVGGREERAWGEVKIPQGSDPFCRNQSQV